jgi:hypothetical protein
MKRLIRAWRWFSLGMLLASPYGDMAWRHGMALRAIGQKSQFLDWLEEERARIDA